LCFNFYYCGSCFK